MKPRDKIISSQIEELNLFIKKIDAKINNENLSESQANSLLQVKQRKQDNIKFLQSLLTK